MVLLVCWTLLLSCSQRPSVWLLDTEVILNWWGLCNEWNLCVHNTVVGVPLPSPKECCWLIFLSLSESFINPSASSCVTAVSPLLTGMPRCFIPKMTPNPAKRMGDVGVTRGLAWVVPGLSRPQGAGTNLHPLASTGISYPKLEWWVWEKEEEWKSINKVSGRGNPPRGENSSASLFFPHTPSYLCARTVF